MSLPSAAERSKLFFQNCLAGAQEIVYFAKHHPCTEGEALRKDSYLINYMANNQSKGISSEQLLLLPPSAGAVVVGNADVPGTLSGAYAGIDSRVNITELWRSQSMDQDQADARMGTITEAATTTIKNAVNDVVEALDFKPVVEALDLKSGPVTDKIGYSITLPTTADLLRMGTVISGVAGQDQYEKEWDKFATSVGSVTEGLNKKIKSVLDEWPLLEMETQSCPDPDVMEGLVTKGWFGLTTEVSERSDAPFTSVISDWKRPSSGSDVINDAYLQIADALEKLPTSRLFRTIKGTDEPDEAYLSMARRLGGAKRLVMTEVTNTMKEVFKDPKDGGPGLGIDIMKRLGENETALKTLGPIQKIKWGSIKANKATTPFIRSAYSVFRDQARRYKARLAEGVTRQMEDGQKSLNAIHANLTQVHTAAISAFPSNAAVNRIKASVALVQKRAEQLAESMRESVLTKVRRTAASRIIAESEFIARAIGPVSDLVSEAVAYITSAQFDNHLNMESVEAWGRSNATRVTNGEFAAASDTLNGIVTGLREQTVATVKAVRVMSSAETFAMVIEEAAAAESRQFPDRNSARSYYNWAFGALALGVAGKKAATALDVDFQRSIDSIKAEAPLYNAREVAAKLVAYEAIASAAIKKRDYRARATTVERIMSGSRDVARGIVKAVGASSPLMIAGWALDRYDLLNTMRSEVGSVMTASVAGTTDKLPIALLTLARVGVAAISELFLRFARFRNWKATEASSVLFQMYFYLHAVEIADVFPETSEWLDVIAFRKVMHELARAPITFVSLEILTQVLNLIFRTFLWSVSAVTHGGTPLLLSPNGTFTGYLRNTHKKLIRVFDRIPDPISQFDPWDWICSFSSTIPLTVDPMADEFEPGHRRLRTAGAAPAAPVVDLGDNERPEGVPFQANR